MRFRESSYDILAKLNLSVFADSSEKFIKLHEFVYKNALRDIEIFARIFYRFFLVLLLNNVHFIKAFFLSSEQELTSSLENFTIRIDPLINVLDFV